MREVVGVSDLGQRKQNRSNDLAEHFVTDPVIGFFAWSGGALVDVEDVLLGSSEFTVRDIALKLNTRHLYSASSCELTAIKRSGMACVNEGSHSFICHPHVYSQV